LDEVPVAAVQIVGDGFALRFEAEAGLTLARRADAKVADEIAGRR